MKFKFPFYNQRKKNRKSGDFDLSARDKNELELAVREQVATEAEILAQKRRAEKRKRELDKKIETIQKSTRVSVGYFCSLHNYLRAKYAWYYRWHLKPYHELVQGISLFIFIAVAGAAAAFSWLVLPASRTVAEGIQRSVTGTATEVNTGKELVFDSETYGSNVEINDSTGIFSGYAWLSDVGWIAFGSEDNPEGPVTVGMTTGAVSGKAKVLTTGDYLDFNASPYGSNVAIDRAGNFSGYAWGNDLGWLDFSGAAVANMGFNYSCTWSAVSSGDWSTAGNWSICGGTAPQTGDIVIFDGTSIQDSTVDAGFSGVPAEVSIDSGYDGAITQAVDLAVSGPLALNDGTWAVGTYDLNLYANSLTIAAGKTLSIGVTAVNGLTAGNIALAGNLTASGAAKINLSGNWDNSGAFTAGNSTVSFTKDADVQTLNSGGSGAGKMFYNLAHSAAGTLRLITNPLNVDGAFINSAGTFDAETNNIAVNFAGDWSNTVSAVFNRGSAAVTFDGTTTIIDSSSNTADLGNLAVTGSITLGSNLIATAFSGGTLNLGSGNTMTLSGAASQLAVASFDKGTNSTVKFTAAGNPVVLPLRPYNNLDLEPATSGTFALAGNATAANAISGNLTIGSNATLDPTAENYQINVGGNWNNMGAFSAQSGRVNFNGTAGQQTAACGSSAFYNLDINNTHANGVLFTNNCTISNNFTATNLSVQKITFTSGRTYSVKNLLMEGNHTTYLRLAATGASAWNLTDLSGNVDVSYVYPSYSNAASIIHAGYSRDGGNNTNWNLVAAVAVDIVPTVGKVHADQAATITLTDNTGAGTSAIPDGVSISVDDGAITPTTLVAGDFSSGVWSGNFVFDAVGSRTVTVTAYTLSAEDTFTASPDVLDHFTMTGLPGTVVTRAAFGSPVAVTAFDSWGNVKIDYAGDVWFESSDPEVTLPYTAAGKYTFTELDAGSHSFAGAGFALKTIGTQTITLTEGSVLVSSGNITVNAAALDHFTVTGYPAAVTAGAAFTTPADDVTVGAVDIYGNTKNDYAGTVWFTTSDSHPSVTLPATVSGKYTFTTGPGQDNGSHLFLGSDFKLITSSTTQTITLTDGSGGAADVASPAITVNPAALNSFLLADYPDATSNQWATAGSDWSTVGTSGGSEAPYDVVATSIDAYGNIKKDYTGKVWFGLDDGIAGTLPFDSTDNAYTFTNDGGAVRTQKSDAADNGRHIFDAVDFSVQNAGSSLNFSVYGDGSVSSVFTIKIKPASIASVSIQISPSFTTKVVDATLTESVIVTAYDSIGNVKNDYTGEVYFGSSDASATLPYTAANKYNFSGLDAGTKTFTPDNTLDDYFTFHSGGNHTITAVAGTESGGTVSADSATFTISAHAPSNVAATPGHEQVTLDWRNPADTAVTKVNIYRSDTEGVLGSKIASPAVTAGSYSQYTATGLTNGSTYYFTLKAVVLKPNQTEYESPASDQVSAVTADLAARNVTASELADGRVKVDYALRYPSAVALDYFNPETNTWSAASSGALSGEVGANFDGSEALLSHTLYWLARTDFPDKYYTANQGFKVRVKVTVPSMGNSIGNTPSPSLLLDTQPPQGASVLVNAGGMTTANLTLTASENGLNAIQMILSTQENFDDADYQVFAPSVSNFEVGDKTTVYVRFRDPFDNTTTVSNTIIPIVDHFALKDASTIDSGQYRLLLVWDPSIINSLDHYIAERSLDGTTWNQLATPGTVNHFV